MRALLSALLLFATLCAPVSSMAQAYPDKPIKLIVPFAAGGGLDATARFLGVHLSKVLGQTIVVDNRPGANGQLGVAGAVGSASDGYTLLFVNGSPLSVRPHLFKTGYDPMTDLAPISMIATNDFVIAVNPSMPAKDAKEYLAAIKASPGKFFYASTGVGSEGQLGFELLKQLGGFDIGHVPFTGDAVGIPNVVNGSVHMIMTLVPTAQPFFDTNRLRPIASTGEQRLVQRPDLPTMTELGFPVVAGSWFGLYAPAKTPQAIIAKLDQAMKTVLESAEVQKQFATWGTRLAYGPPEVLARKLRQEFEIQGKVIRAAKITAE